MSKTVVGLFESIAKAEQVKQTLVADGYDSQSIRVVANDEGSTGSTGVSGTTTGSALADKDYTDIGSGGGTGVGEKISSFFRNLAGGDEHAHNHYATGVNEGGALLAATVADERASAVASTLREYGARDIEGGTQQRGVATAGATTGATGYAAGTGVTSGETTIPVIEEELVVGKREVDRGGVRVYSHLVERPVEADVTLREEHISVERRPVNRLATAADFESGRGGVIELNATGEEAVVGKSSRVVEEVLVGKESSQHTQAVHDTVRKTEVEVENLPGETLKSDRI